MVSAAVIGDPIAHSQSPQLHMAAYAAMGLDGSAYERLRVPAGELAERWRAGEFAPFTGLSVTMPHKQDAAALASRQSPRVRLLGAANTLVFQADGSVFAENTDVDGIVDALRLGVDQRPHLGRSTIPSPPLGSGLIVGGGGTATAALAACSELGVGSVTVALRSVSKADDGPHALRSIAESLGIALAVVPLDSVQEAIEAGPGVVLCTLPPRAADPFAESWAQAARASLPTLLDVAYDPWPSRLAGSWPGRVVHGLEMLLYQAVRQVELFTGRTPGPDTVAAMASAARLPERTL